MRKEIIVIGGGIAGLSAASFLVRQDFSVTILEAADRLGGRIYTLQHAEYLVELGAEFLHGDNEAVHNALNAAGLTTHEVSDDYQVWDSGRLKPLRFWDQMTELIHRVDACGRDVSFGEFLKTQNLEDS